MVQINNTVIRDLNQISREHHQLGDAEARRVAAFAFELWKSRATFEEFREGPVDVRDGLLEELTVAFAQPGGVCFGFEGREFKPKLFFGEGRAGFGVVGFTSCERPVIDEPSAAREAQQAVLLSPGGLQAEAVHLA